MLKGKLPPEIADCWKWRPGLEWDDDVAAEGKLVGKQFEELEGWAGSARHGIIAHTWGN
jgi:hypothetical protein